jgi:ribosome biogenesis GTPase
MANLFDRERNRRTQAKKDKKATKSGEWLDEDAPLLYETGVLAAIHSKRFDIMKDDVLFPATLDKELCLQEEHDFAVGDRVFFQKGENGVVTVLGREKRTSVVMRSRADWSRSNPTLEEHALSANVDIGIITVSVKDPDFHQSFIDRYLAVLQSGNVQPLICLTKIDLSDVQPEILAFYERLMIPIIRTSTTASKGIEELKATLRGKTAVFLGQSGVDKSSLMNALLPGMVVDTGEVNERTGKGGHTTTGSSLLAWDTHSYIIDTPGIRSLGVDQLPRAEIKYLFPEFEMVGAACRFSDCLHLSEPDCAVKSALEKKDPNLNQYRYDSYVKMMAEEAGRPFKS